MSASYDLILRAGTLVTPSGPVKADLGVADGRIAAIEPELEGTAAVEIVALGLHVFPGVVDAHVHLNDPGRADWEGWATGSAALAAGGATAALDMPLNARPPTLDAASFAAKRAAAEAAAVVDFAFWGGLVPGPLDRLDELAAAGAVGFKAFMAESGVPDFPLADDLTLWEGMARAARLGLPVAVHAENETLTRGLGERAIAAGRTGVQDYLASRPVVAELEAIGRALLFAAETGCALHVAHVSTGRGVALIAAARARGVDVTCETCPHYLALTAEDAERLGALAKCAPPLRPAPERDLLWGHLAAGDLPIVASDHSPAPPALKTGADIFRVWGGIAGCQTLLPLLLTEGHHARGVPLARLADVAAGAPACRFRLRSKGHLAPGADADLALVALDAPFTLAASDLRSRHPHSPFVGRAFRGRVVRTLLRGITTFQRGRSVTGPIGRLLRPAGEAPAPPLL